MRTLKELETSKYLQRQKQNNGRIVYRLAYSDPEYQNGTKPESQNGTVPKRHSAEMVPISNTDVRSNKDVISNKDNTDVLGKAYGKKEINDLISCLQDQLENIPLDGTQKENRNYANLLLKKLEKVCKDQGRPINRAVEVGCFIIKAAHTGWHAKNATNMKYIYYNMGKIVNENRQIKTKKKGLLNKIISWQKQR